jgi:hypothetical protein
VLMEMTLFISMPTRSTLTPDVLRGHRLLIVEARIMVISVTFMFYFASQLLFAVLPLSLPIYCI